MRGSLLAESARREGIPVLTMQSGAGHDSQLVTEIADVAMIFVRSAGGRSHTPAEFTSAEDAALGIRLLAVLHRLAY